MNMIARATRRSYFTFHCPVGSPAAGVQVAASYDRVSGRLEALPVGAAENQSPPALDAAELVCGALRDNYFFFQDVRDELAMIGVAASEIPEA